MRSLLAIATLAGVAGCQPYRVEYHERPGVFQAAADEELPDRITMPDGTIIVYKPVDTIRRNSDGDDGGEVFEPWKVKEDGTLLVRALLPEQVLANTLGCIHNEAYDVLWEQVLSDRTKEEFARNEEGFDEFRGYFVRNRIELARTLNRMVRGLALHDAVVESIGQGVIQYRFQPRIGQVFRFRLVRVIQEGQWFKLLTIR